MTRSDYHVMRRERHRLIQKIANLREHADMADSRLVVQIGGDNDYIGSCLRKLRGIELMIAPNRDPLGFRVMQQNWMRRRSHVLARVRAEAGRAGDGDRFIRLHVLYNANVRQERMALLQSIAA